MLRGVLLAAAAAAATTLIALPATAAAQETVVSYYHPDANSRSFNTSEGGWTASSSSDGPCVPSATCPAVANGFVNNGGTGGGADGHLRTAFGSVANVAGRTRAIWESPSFDYLGAQGQQPTLLLLSLAVRADIGALLSVPGSRVDTTVEVVDETANDVAIRIVDQFQLGTTGGWFRGPLLPVDATELVIGRRYKLRVATRAVYDAEVIPAATVDYDDVGLLAARVSGADDGDDVDDRGGNKRPGGRRAIFDGRHLFLKLKCYGVKDEDGRCSTRARALKTKKQGGTRYTFPIEREVKAGKKGKVVRARVRFKFRNKLERRRTIVLRSVVREDANDRKAVVKRERLRLIKRNPGGGR